MSNYCKFCLLDGRFPVCTCGYDGELDCADKPACVSCQKTHKRIGNFFRQLLKSKAATRSNSPRTRLLAALHETIVIHRSAMRSSEYFLDVLRNVSAFSLNDGNFQGSVGAVARSWPTTKAVNDSLFQKLDDFRVVRAMETLTEIAAEKFKQEKQRDETVRAIEKFAFAAAEELIYGGM